MSGSRRVQSAKRVAMGRGMDRRTFAGRTLGALAALALGRLGRGDAQAASVVRRTLRPGSPWAPHEELLTEIPTLMELATVPGVAFAVVDGDRVSSYTFGRARRELQIDVATSTLFEAASLGKPVFAAAALRMVDARELDLDRPLSAYLALPEAPGTKARAITARHVLSHTTGLPNWRLEPGPLEPSSDPGDSSAIGRGNFLPAARPGASHRETARPVHARDHPRPARHAQQHVRVGPDSNAHMATGYDERGTALEVYADIGRKLAPLATEWGKPMTDWTYADEERATRLAFPSLPTLPLYMVPNAAGSLLTTIDDYGRFLIGILSEGGAGLSEGIRREMLTPQVKLNSALSWGLGWGIEHDEQGDLIWHWGANGSFRNFVLADPKHRRGSWC